MSDDDGTQAKGRLRGIARRAMVSRGLEPDFPPEAKAELKDITHAAVDGDASIRDLRARLWCSIDNDDSRDLDQLSVAEIVGADVKIFVAIADVDAIVRRGSALDAHAAANTTSVYTAAMIFPMLPEKLSTDLSSLNEGQERVAIVIEMSIGADGALKASDVYRARVVNRAKLAYDSVAAWLDGGPALAKVAVVPGMDEQLRIQDGVAQKLKARRHEQGALTLETREARPVFEGDALSDLRVDQPNRAKQLIEDFMVAANGVTARFLAGKKFPSLRRVLRSPERWERIVALAAQLGEKLPAEPSALALDTFLEKRRKAAPERFADLSLSVVKLLGRGEYAKVSAGQTAEGHFGLAVRDYTHSTAPNRRFPDLVTQRLVKAALAGKAVPYSDAELAALAEHCTTQEDAAAKVERQVRKSAAALLLASRIGERFDAIVSGASDKGTWVHLDHPAVEGKLIHGERGLDVGDRLKVKLVHTDIDRGFVDFERAGS